MYDIKNRYLQVWIGLHLNIAYTTVEKFEVSFFFIFK